MCIRDRFKPALLTKVVEGAPLQVDVSANFMFMEKFVVGAAYRWDAAVSALAGFQISDGLYIGYGYDMDTTNLKNYDYGSHEIFLRYELFNNIKEQLKQQCKVEHLFAIRWQISPVSEGMV